MNWKQNFNFLLPWLPSLLSKKTQEHEYLRSRAYEYLSLSLPWSLLKIDPYWDTRAYILDLASEHFSNESNT